MSTDRIELGSAPCDEECVQVRKDGEYLDAMRAELKRYKAMLEKMFPVPEGINARFSIVWAEHEFGRYGEVAVVFDQDDEKSADWAWSLESKTPTHWEPENTGPSNRFKQLIAEAERSAHGRAE